MPALANAALSPPVLPTNVANEVFQVIQVGHVARQGHGLVAEFAHESVQLVSSDRANSPTCQACATAIRAVAAPMPLYAQVMKSAFVLMSGPAE